MTNQQFPARARHQADGPSEAGPAGPGDPGARPARHTVRNSLVGALCGVAVLALVASVLLAVSGKTITIGSPPAPGTAAPASVARSSAPAAAPSGITKVITRWRTRTVISSAMERVSVLDPTGTGAMDQGWQSTIPCTYVASDGQLVLGDAGAAGQAVSETCTLTFVQLVPAVNGMAVVLKDSAGHQSNFALTAAS